MSVGRNRTQIGQQSGLVLRRRVPLVAVGIAVTLGIGVASLLLRPSYDEYFWLAIARKVSQGYRLYFDAIDNKTPFVYGLSWLLDIVRGHYVLARSLLLAASAAAASCLASKVAQERTNSIGFGRLIGATVALVLVLHAQLVLTTEVVATTLLLVSVGSAILHRLFAAQGSHGEQ